MTTAAILTVSDTRNLETDTSGQLISSLCEDAGMAIFDRQVVIDDPLDIQISFLSFERQKLDLIITNGGTGIAQRDVTIPAIAPLLTKLIPGFGEAFRAISFREIGTRALASRAEAGFNLRGQLCYLLPGAGNACQTAMEKLILPEYEHLLYEHRK
ncbi:molybdenum cofactor biosynthesis protein MoaB [Sporolactobacillus sp. CQH2019]|uniref:MogA/MoaB family molybdenum cofactor biosynthesis protein n=1 Tax=Sporolactobacillus sp. CQH2019 TaxID=3023512 RepID=UPI002367D834|nr:molybdenum cofactor biosynthesis protein B [Sporolactobacillus sp. CQH2019]MDD9149602.1 molybdenum cofactor biosynthesis protein MoaB [Sporolactobacillus sp. CQH2019]